MFLLTFVVFYLLAETFAASSTNYHIQDVSYDDREIYFNEEGVGLFPPLTNLARHADIWANATCGEEQAEVFCRRPADKEARKSNQCKLLLCDARKNGARRMVDGSRESWISPTLENGMDFQYVTITLDLKEVFQIAYITMKAGVSPRPAAMILERSLDGEEFYPWQFYAENDSACKARFGLPATSNKAVLEKDDQVTCTAQYSKMFPLENGEIHTSLVSGRPGINSSSSQLKNFTQARFIRFRLQKIHKTERDSTLKKRLFYSIRAIAIGGQCICNGHASKCSHNADGIPQCECEHGTCGTHCETCCPLLHQHKWAPGTSESASACQPCQCFGHASDCRYNSVVASAKLSLDTTGLYRGGGECIDCVNHTTGVNCERCEKGWYRPLGIRPDDPSSCLPCQCHPKGTMSTCAHDDSHPGKPAGYCECRPGFTGEKCDACVGEHRQFPACEACDCDSRGSVPNQDCSVECLCKKNVVGKNCETCKPGYFALSENNPEGCAECFCSGVSTECSVIERSAMNTTEYSLEKWTVSDLNGEQEVAPSEDPETGVIYIGNYEVPPANSYYWASPPELSSSLLHGYGTNTFVASVGWEAMRGDTSGQPTRGPNFIILGRNGVRIGYGDVMFEGRKGEIELRAPLVHSSWYTIPEDIEDISEETDWLFRGLPVTRVMFLAVLASVERVLVRARFHTDQAEGCLITTRIEKGFLEEMDSEHHAVEQCVCPPGYMGLSCEMCSFGYYADNSTTGAFQCIMCPCNGHANCDPETLVCLECQHNTTGDDCGVCEDGYYGDARNESDGDCLPCACPLTNASNNFSPTCEVLADGNFTCTACSPPYTGQYCQKCADGFYGEPSVEGGSCVPCECKGGACDPVTGGCLQCDGNTDGPRCDVCKPHHYGDPLIADCKPCECYEEGSENGECDSVTGKCRCQFGFAGRRCSSCDVGFGNLTAGCPACGCGVAASDAVCDVTSGTCPCHAGAIPPLCDSCLPLHFGLNTTGCLGCGCHPAGSEAASCDIVTGQCTCKENVTGRACDQCQSNSWGLSSGKGCRPCECDEVGADGNGCDHITGQCRCRAGVGGVRCDSCLPGFFGFSDTGCRPCEVCDATGHVCDSSTGRCVCPPNTHGHQCQSCTANSWGFRPRTGCHICDCDSGGATRAQCDLKTGECECRTGFTGRNCSSCADGYFGYPMCKPCLCNADGSISSACDEDGACTCKLNVHGPKCDTCRPGTFGLQFDNPNGCTACFCFGRSASCTQAGLSWNQIRSGRSRSVSIEYDPSPPFQNTLPIDTQEICYINLAMPGGDEVTLNGGDRGLNVTNNLRTIPGDTEDVKIGVSFLFDTPVYWQLPQQFLGDKVLSYGGFLKFSVETEGGQTKLPPGVLETYPLIQVQGNNRIVLEYFPILHSPLGRYDVRFHESLWYEKNPKRQATRETLMVALQNLQHVLIRASDSVDFTKIVLKDVAMDTADIASSEDDRGISLAGGVERCQCPPQYNSSSCQDPSIGFFRWFNRSRSSATILISLVGEARPCQCNSRSKVCDIETGSCKDCSQNTGGQFCERCADGFYGDPSLGPCLPCPCPAPGRNFATGCQVVPGRDPICFCRPGYTGKYCDRCGYGWFGYPDEPTGYCQLCQCHPFGSVSDECDEHTGQCNCRPGILGQNCSICPNNTVLTSKGCSTCEDGCTGILLQDLRAMHNSLSVESSRVLDRSELPWYRLQEFVTQSVETTEKALIEWNRNAHQFNDLLSNDSHRRLGQVTSHLLEKTEKCANESADVANVASILKSQTDVLNSRILDVRTEIETIISGLQHYSNNGEHRILSDTAALKEAKRLLEKITSRYLVPKREQAENILDMCTSVLLKTRFLEDVYPELQDSIERLSALVHKLDELQSLVQSTLVDSEKRSIETGEIRRKLRGVQEKLDKANSQLVETKQFISEAEGYLAQAGEANSVAVKNYNNVTNVRMMLRNSSLILERKEGILYGLNPLYRSKHVTPAQDHAHALKRLVADYQQLFNNSIGDASQAVEASKAYQEIIGTVEGVREAAESATVSAEIALKEVFPVSNEDSVVEKAQISKALSSRLLTKAKMPLAGGQELRASLQQQKMRVKVLEETVQAADEQNNAVSSELQKLEKLKIGEQVKNSIARVESIENQVGEAKETAEKLIQNMENKLRPQLSALSTEAKQLDLNKARLDIEESLQANQRATDMLRQLTAELDLRKQRETFRLTNESISSVLTNLRNKITEARHAAHSVRLSLSSNSTRGCIRSYRTPHLEPTIGNRIVLTMSLSARDKNGLIFYLPSSTTQDFLALELVNGKFRFVWDLGGGSSFVTKSLPTDGKTSGMKWYKVVVERTSYTAKLWVLPGGFPEEQVPPAQNSSTSDFGWLDVNSSDRLWVGGLPPGLEAPPLITSTHAGLVGCLHSIVLDDNPIGLWDFFMDHTDSCSACVKGVEEVVDESSYRFNGDGYSVLQHVTKSTYNKYQFSVALKFKTFDENAVLFIAVSTFKDRYVSILLRDGRVVFQIGYGGETQLEMSSTKKYNDGNWASIEASRSFDRRRGIEKGLLKVGEEAKEAAPPSPPLQTQIPELSGADFLVGGIPQGYSFGQLHLRFPKSLLGCMGDLFIDKELYNPLRGRSNGVSPSCTEKKVKMAGFHGDGFMKMEATQLKRKATFSLVLRTLQADALVLLAKNTDVVVAEDENDISGAVTSTPHREGYYSIALVDGRVEVRLEAGRGAVTLVSQALVNDGRFHAVTVVKTGRKVELRVDDELQASSTLPEGATVVRVDDLYLGGVPKIVDAAPFASDVTSFAGTIKDVLFDFVLRNLDSPMLVNGVDLGRPGPEGEGLVPIRSLVRTTTPHPGCRRSRKYVVDPRAVKFGDSPNSHVQLHLRRRNMFSRNFTLELDFRTFYPDGLLFLVPGTHQGVVKLKHFLLGGLRNGIVNIIVKGKRKIDLVSSQKVNDGSWHHISLVRIDRRLSMAVDSAEPAVVKLPKKINSGSILYIGGLPDKNVLLPDNLLSRVEGFRGCVRNLRLSNQSEDLIGDKTMHERVGQCFPHVEPGSYFSGDAYVIHRKDFLVEDLLKLELDFRTSELNGILLSITDSPGYPAFSLEFSSGKVILSGDTGDRRIFQLSHDLQSQYALCDNKWHHVAVSYEAEEVVMRVDDQTSRLNVPRNNYFLKTYINTPMYVGGLPEHIPGGKPLLETRDNFKGCMRNLAIGGEKRDWREMHELRNVLIGSCPAVTHH